MSMYHKKVCDMYLSCLMMIKLCMCSKGEGEEQKKKENTKKKLFLQFRTSDRNKKGAPARVS